MSTSSSKSPRGQQKTTVTRHNTRSLREKRPQKFLGERLFKSAIFTARNTSDEELGEQWKASSSVVLRTVNRYRGGGNIGVVDRVKKPLTPTSRRRFRARKEKCRRHVFRNRNVPLLLGTGLHTGQHCWI